MAGVEAPVLSEGGGVVTLIESSKTDLSLD